VKIRGRIKELTRKVMKNIESLIISAALTYHLTFVSLALILSLGLKSTTKCTHAKINAAFRKALVNLDALSKF